MVASPTGDATEAAKTETSLKGIETVNVSKGKDKTASHSKSPASTTPSIPSRSSLLTLYGNKQPPHTMEMDYNMASLILSLPEASTECSAVKGIMTMPER